MLETETNRPAPEPVPAAPCRSCGTEEAVAIVEFRGVPCRRGLPPEGHLHAEPVCNPCRRMLARARAWAAAWKDRN